jgi:hypothetical protein
MAFKLQFAPPPDHVRGASDVPGWPRVYAQNIRSLEILELGRGANAYETYLRDRAELDHGWIVRLEFHLKSISTIGRHPCMPNPEIPDPLPPAEAPTVPAALTT